MASCWIGEHRDSPDRADRSQHYGGVSLSDNGKHFDRRRWHNRYMLGVIVQAARRRTTNTSTSAFSMFRHLGAVGLFFLAILDSTPLPTFGGPDILIVILVVTRHNPWYEYAAAATAGSMIGAYITFTLARKAGKAYLEKSFGRRLPKLLKLFDRWGTGALIASSAVPIPLPTSVFFAAAGASDSYSTTKFLVAVGASRGARYSAVAIIGRLFGRHVIRILRHPAQHWSWLLLIGAIFVFLMLGGVLLNRRAEAHA